MATSFDFKLTSNYYSISDTFEGTAEIISTNKAKYVYGIEVNESKNKPSKLWSNDFDKGAKTIH